MKRRKATSHPFCTINYTVRRVWYLYYYFSSLLEPCQPKSLIFLQSFFYYYHSIFIKCLSLDFSVVRIPISQVIVNANLDFSIIPPSWVFPYWPVQLFFFFCHFNLDTGSQSQTHTHTHTQLFLETQGWDWSLLGLGREKLCKLDNCKANTVITWSSC